MPVGDSRLPANPSSRWPGPERLVAKEHAFCGFPFNLIVLLARPCLQVALDPGFSFDASSSFDSLAWREMLTFWLQIVSSGKTWL